MVKILKDIEISATKDLVWNIVSDLESEADYWYGTQSVRTVAKNGNVVDREVTGKFRNNIVIQKAILKPEEYQVEVRYLKGPTEGIKVMSVESLEPNKQKLKVYWDIRFTGVYWLLTPLIKRHTTGGTIHALQRIKLAAEKNDVGKVPSPATHLPSSEVI
jgi:hypothetical protein